MLLHPGRRFFREFTIEQHAIRAIFLCRIGLIHEMCQAYKEQYYFENGIVEVLAVTAVPMSAALTDKLRGKMEQVTGKKVELKCSVDPSIMGGIVVKVNNEQFDTSLRTRLEELAARLTGTQESR